MKLGNHMVNAGQVRAVIRKVISEYHTECPRAQPHLLKLEHRLSEQLAALTNDTPQLTEEEQVVEHIKLKRHHREKKRSPNQQMLDAMKQRGRITDDSPYLLGEDEEEPPC